MKRTGLKNFRVASSTFVLALRRRNICKVVESMNERVTQRLESALESSSADFKFTESQMKALPALSQVNLHAHQLEGVSWMLQRWKADLNVIIADEMGLGKTLQTLSFLAFLKDVENVSGPYLVVAPLSVAPQWISQSRQFIPSLRTFEYLGPAAEREEHRRYLIEEHILKLPKEVRESGDPQPLPFDIFVTSYETCLSDMDFIERLKWRVIVYDEGHRLKNPDGVTHQTFMSRLSAAKFKIILTGTPIQNNLVEFWSLLRFLNPRVFPESTRPDPNFPPSITVMNKIVHALVLRRLFSSISGISLPELDNLVIRTAMSPIQAELYRWALFHYAASQPAHASSAQPPPAGILSNLLMTLRKIASHPYLIPGVEPEPFQEGAHIWQNSNKFQVLRALLGKMKAEGSRCLIFSNFTSLLDICQDFFDLENINYERLDGSVRREDRTLAIDRFSDDRASVFLLSTRAGGVGLNLTAANWVVFLDTDWNPQMDLQAMARVFRQGQKKRVKVFRLVTVGTVDELMFSRSLEKLKFASDVLQESQPDVGKLKSLALHGIGALDVANASGVMPVAPANHPTVASIDIESLIESVDEEPELIVGEHYKQFEGIDYAASRVVVPEAAEADVRAMDLLMDKAKLYKPPKPPAPSLSVSSVKQRAQQLTAEQRQKRKEEQWKQLGYTSFLLESGDAERVPGDIVGQIHHVYGSFVEPERVDGKQHIITHVVDQSGVWPTNSRLFMSVAEKFPEIPKQYHKAKEAGDLRIGTVHLFPQLDGTSVALLVCHRNDDFETFKTCVKKLGEKFGPETTFHFSRIGDKRNTFYIAERLINRYVCAAGADAVIYYFRPLQPRPVPAEAEPSAEKKRMTLMDYFKAVVPEPVPSSPHQASGVKVWISPRISQDLGDIYKMEIRKIVGEIVSPEKQDDADISILSIHEDAAMGSSGKEWGMVLFKAGEKKIMTTEELEKFLVEHKN